MESLVGQLIVATPVLMDPNFAKTVVLVVQHDESGCVGLVLNRLTLEPVESHLPAWSPCVTDPPLVNYGGPVDPAVAIAIGQTTEGESTGVPGLSLIDLDSDPNSHSEPIRIYSGYSGWDADQLEDEVASGAWYIVSATPDDPFRHPDGLWRSVLRRQPGMLSVVSTYADDANLN